MELEGILRRNGVMEYWSDGVMGRSHNTEPRAQNRGNGVLEYWKNREGRIQETGVRRQKVREGAMEYWSTGVVGTSHNTETRAQDRGNGVVEKTGVQKSEVRSRKTRR